MAHLTEETQPCFETTIKSKAVSETCNVKFSCVVTGKFFTYDYEIPILKTFQYNLILCLSVSQKNSLYIYNIFSGLNACYFNE